MGVGTRPKGTKASSHQVNISDVTTHVQDMIKGRGGVTLSSRCDRSLALYEKVPTFRVTWT